MRNKIYRKSIFVGAACVLAALTVSASSAAASEITFETRALTDDVGPLGPGLGADVEFLDFLAPLINSEGQIAFQAFLTGSAVETSNNIGIWSEGGGSGLSLIARKGSQAPGTADGVNFKDFAYLAFNGAGHTAFRGDLDGEGLDNSNNLGIWSEAAGAGLALVVRSGDQAPGADGQLFYYLSEPVPLESGKTVIHSRLKKGALLGDNGIWIHERGSGLTKLALDGDQAPGAPVRVYFDFLESPNVNEAGQIGFRSDLVGDGSNYRGIWSEGGGAGLALVARIGDPAPGMDDGVTFSNLGGSAFNNAGQTAFFGRLKGSEVTELNDGGVWSEGGGSGLALIARTGDNAPGTEVGVSFARTPNVASIMLNGAGHTAFLWEVIGEGVDSSNDTGIWSEVGGSGLALIARTGDQAPGAADGVNFSHLVDPVLNGAGQIAFLGEVAGPGVTSSNDSGLWATDRDGLLRLIVRAGDSFDVSDDPQSPDLRTVSAVDLVNNSGGEDGRPTSFNDAGQLAFELTFTNFSRGIFVATFAAPPDTSPVFTLAIAAVAQPATGYDLSWESQPGKVYDLVTSTDLATPIFDWPVYDPDGPGGDDPYGDIPGAGATTTLTAVPADGPVRFFVVVEKDAP